MIVTFVIVLFFICVGFVVIIFIKAQQRNKYQKASLLYKDEAYEEALKLFQELQLKYPRKRLYNWYIGLCYESLKNYELALVEYNKVALSTSFDSSLNEVAIHEKIALMNLNIGNINRALQEYRIIVDLYPQHAQAYYNLGCILVQRGELQRAVKYFDNAVKFQEDFPNAYLELGKASYTLKRYEKARNYFLNAITQDTALTEAHFYYAITLEKERSYKKSIEEFQYALRDDQYKFDSYVHIGNIYMALSNKKQAFDFFEKALSFGTSDVKSITKAKYKYAYYLIQSGDINKALKLWKEIDDLDPLYLDVRSKIEIYGEISKSTNLARFITATKQDFLQTARELCSILKVKVQKRISAKKDFIEFIGNFRIGREDMNCVVDIARWINQVGEIPLRELLEKMTDTGASKGIFVTASHFTQKAIDLSNIRPLEIIDKERLEKMLSKVYTRKT